LTAIWGALAGAAATALLGSLLGYFNYRRTTKRQLDVAALRCLDRLHKIEAASGERLPRNDAEIEALPPERRTTVNNELVALGGNADAYLDSIAAVWPYERSRHLPLYKDLRPILLNHDLSTIPALSVRLEAVALELTWFARAWARGVGFLRGVVLRPRA
jgi:hypothetical protein